MFLAALMLSAAAVMCSCRHGGVQDAADSAFMTTVIERADSADSALQCKIRADYPTGHDTLSLAVRRFVCAQLASNYLPQMNCPDSAEAYPLYAGSTGKGGDVVDYYVGGTLSFLKGQAAEMLRYGSRQPMSYDLSVTLSADTVNYLSYEVKSYAYLGGAHGSAADYTVNIAKPSGNVLSQTVDTLKVKALQPVLRKGVLGYLRGNGADYINEHNLTEYLFVSDGIIPLPAHAPYLAADGVHFVYQQYEIGPYAMGMVSFTVPYDEIKPYLTEEALRLMQ